ncbi:hypothetical protein EDD15DRAFT_2359515 [Pisolithus albus]|nr:hypothetical protein EDD15DRAFT_2359515 [Pisolithus albus]
MKFNDFGACTLFPLLSHLNSIIHPPLHLIPCIHMHPLLMDSLHLPPLQSSQAWRKCIGNILATLHHLSPTSLHEWTMQQPSSKTLSRIMQNVDKGVGGNKGVPRSMVMRKGDDSQRQREQHIRLLEEAHHAQHQRELEQQQHLSQALNEFGRLSGEHYAQDEERRRQRSAEENPGANDDLAIPDPPPPPPPGPPGPPPPPPGPPGPPPPPTGPPGHPPPPPGPPPPPPLDLLDLLDPLDPLALPLLLDLQIHATFHQVAGHMLNLSSPTLLDL